MIDPMPGDIFRKNEVLNNTYEIEGVLGRGGTGEVYRACNQISGRVVAIKALNRAFSGNADYLELLKREEEMRAISHDAVVRYTDCSRTDRGHVYLVMDYIDGTPLSDWLERGGANPRDLLVVAHRVAEGLAATHAKGIVHRDLSPDNILLRGGEPEQAVIIDFGIAKDTRVGARTIVGRDFAGKYEYAAPEQMHGQAEPRSDLYALGASLLATYRGQVPDVGSSPGEVIRTKEAPLNTEGVPEPLRSLIADLTQPDPARRPPDAASVVKTIDRLLQPADNQPTMRRRRWLLVAIPVAAALLALAWVLEPFDRLGGPPVASLRSDLTASALQAVLDPIETCGPLTVGPPGTMPLGGSVDVAGRVAESKDRDEVEGALRPQIGDRSLQLDLEVLNPTVCSVLSLLPQMPGDDIEIRLGYGDGPELNPSGVYDVGDNPTVDVVVPTELDAKHIWVSIVDVAGGAYNLLPNRFRPEHQLSQVGTVENEIRSIRVAYSFEERDADRTRAALEVSEDFGKSLVLAVISDRPLFSELRPREESARSFAEDLAGRLGEVGVEAVATRLVDSRGQ